MGSRSIKSPKVFGVSNGCRCTSESFTDEVYGRTSTLSSGSLVWTGSSGSTGQWNLVGLKQKRKREDRSRSHRECHPCGYLLHLQRLGSIIVY